MSDNVPGFIPPLSADELAAMPPPQGTTYPTRDERLVRDDRLMYVPGPLGYQMYKTLIADKLIDPKDDYEYYFLRRRKRQNDSGAGDVNAELAGVSGLPVGPEWTLIGLVAWPNAPDGYEIGLCHRRKGGAE